MASKLAAAARAQLAPTGALRAGLNLSNVLLITGKDAAGDPKGIAPDMARAIARALGVQAKLVPFPHPDKLCEAAGDGVWDIGLIGADPARAAKISFTPAYCEIQATYMVPVGSPVRTMADVDKAGHRIATKKGGAYDLWLTRNIKEAELLRAETLDASYALFREKSLEALAGLRPKLSSDLEKDPGLHRLLDGSFMAVQQAVGCLKPADGSSAGIDFLTQFIEEAKSSGLVEELISQHGVKGKLSVAPPASS